MRVVIEMVAKKNLMRQGFSNESLCVMFMFGYCNVIKKCFVHTSVGVDAIIKEKHIRIVLIS